MTKLKRQTISELSDRLYNAINIDASDIFSEQYCKSEDVSALEAENERLREAIKTALVDIAELEVILNREQEKQP